MYSAVNESDVLTGVGALMDYLHLKHPNFPKEVTDLSGAVDFLNQESRLILVPVSLEGDWYRTAAGPLLVQDLEGMDLAVLPDWRGRYYFLDGGTGQRVYISEKNCRQFSLAYSVTLDFPSAVITAPRLIGRMLREISWYEAALLAMWGILGGGLWALLAGQVHSALSGVILTADRSDLFFSVAAILTVSVLEALLVFTGRQVVRRGAEKGALTVLIGVGKRLYATQKPEEGAAAGLMAFRDNGERVMHWILSALWGGLAVLVAVIALANRSPEGAVAAGVLALVLYGAAAAVFLGLARRQVDCEENQERRTWILRQAADRELGFRRSFPQRWDRACRSRLLGEAWPAVALLAIPMVYFILVGGHSTARLMQTMLLYLPAVALPLGVLLDAAGAGRSMAEIRSLLPLAQKPSAGTAALPPIGSIFELKDVSFSYPGQPQPVLREVNLRVHPGEAVGILGATGSGKTTLKRLMTGLVRPTAGNIYYGGIELSRFNASALRRRVAWEQGADILLCGQIPEQRDGRACVVFSSREENLAGCDRIVRLENGRLTARPN